MYLLLVILTSAITAYGDYFMKVAGERGFSPKPFLIGMFLYVATGPCWYFLMKMVKLSTIGVVYGVTTAMLLAFFGVAFFGEKLSAVEALAIAMGLVTIIILAPRFS